MEEEEYIGGVESSRLLRGNVLGGYAIYVTKNRSDASTLTSKEKKIPIGIKVVCILVAIFGLLSLAIGFSGLLEELSLFVILLGIAELITRWGLWTIKTWAWYAAMILFGISFIQNIIPPIEPPSIFAIVVFIIPILTCLYRQRNIYIGKK